MKSAIKSVDLSNVKEWSCLL